MAVVTRRCENRIAAQTTNGSARKASDTDIPLAALPPKIKKMARPSDNHRAVASMAFMGGQFQERRVLQLNSNGVTMIMPDASPCHQVHAFATTSDHLRIFDSASEPT